MGDARLESLESYARVYSAGGLTKERGGSQEVRDLWLPPLGVMVRSLSSMICPDRIGLGSIGGKHRIPGWELDGLGLEEL